MSESIRDHITTLATRVRQEQGATAVEYSLMLALVAVVVLSTIAALGGVIDTALIQACDSVTFQPGAGGDCLAGATG